MQIFLGFHYKKQFQEWMTRHRWKAKWGVITEDLSIPNRIKIYSRKKVFTILCFPSSLATREPIVNKCIMIQHGDCNEYLFLTYKHLQSHLIIIIKGNLFIIEDNACLGQPPSLCRPPMDKMFTFKVSNVNLSSPNPPQSNDNPMLKIMVLTVHCLCASRATFPHDLSTLVSLKVVIGFIIHMLLLWRCLSIHDLRIQFTCPVLSAR